MRMKIYDKDLQERCSRCPWRKEMYRDNESNYISIYCMFPRCIWTSHVKKDFKPLKKRKDFNDD